MQIADIVADAATQFGVQVPQRPGIDAERAVFRLLPLLFRLIMQLCQIGLFRLDRQALFGRLHMRVARAAPPDVTARIAGLGLHLI